MIGTRLGQFRVLEQIGAGGMGVVYKAKDESLDREVVLKVLPPGALADETARKRFREEALALSRLNHPNICTIYQVGEAGGRTYIAMEYVQGRPLNRLIREGPISVDAVARYGEQIADGLAHAHERGLTHRDMKSSNVMITPDGRAKVLDFGLAIGSASPESGSEAAPMTQTNAVVGTPAYVPPEVIRGERADARSDIWGLGIILYEMVTGSPPFKGSGHGLMYAILERSATLPEATSPALRSVIHRCLAKQPGERYQGAGEVGAALKAIEADSTLAPSSHAPRRRRSMVVSVLLGVAASGALALLAFGIFDVGPPFAGPVEAASIESIAVLPFTNFSGDPDQEYFVDGMTDALIGELAKLGTLNVIARTSVMAYKESSSTIQDIASELDVDGIVEGSAVSSGGRVRLSARLIHAGSNDNLWAEDYERDLGDILSIQSEMARTIGGQIQEALTPEAEARLGVAGPVDPDAYELTLQGRFLANRLSQEGLEQGIEYFDRAIARDPRYAPAYAGKAFSYVHLSVNQFIPPLIGMPEAKAAAQRAIQLDDNLSEAHAWLGYAHLFFDWDWSAAESELLRALELNPNSAEAHLAYAGYLASLGKIDAAMSHVARAKEIDPQSIVPFVSVNGSQWITFISGRYEESIREGRQALELDPSGSFAHAQLGLPLVGTGAFEEGIDELRQGVRLEDAPMLKSFLAYGLARAGREEDSRTLLTEVEETYREFYTCAYEIAVVYVGLGDEDAAFEWLDQAFEDRADCIPWMNLDPRLDPLRDDPRFETLLERAGFPSANAQARGEGVDRRLAFKSARPPGEIR